MTLPPQIELRARCAAADNLSGLILMMQLTAGYKNPYCIFFPKTDTHGHTRLTAEDIRGQFSDHREEALMDYDGSIEEANDLVTIHLWDPRSFREHYNELLSWPVFSHQQKRWRTRREYQDYMASCHNDEFTFGGISLRLPETTLLYVSLRRAVASQAG